MSDAIFDRMLTGVWVESQWPDHCSHNDRPDPTGDPAGRAAVREVPRHSMLSDMGKAAARVLEVRPLTPDRWADFERLFGERGACGGCWCMWWRLTHSQFEKDKGAKNRRAMKSLIESGEVPGLLGYRDGSPVAWCSVQPRESFPRLGRSRILKPIDDKPVWSVVCLFVAKSHRNQGLSIEMLRGAVEHVRQNGGKIVEGYAVEPKKDRMPDVFAFNGPASAFKKAGFTECARRSETRPIMRYEL